MSNPYELLGKAAFPVITISSFGAVALLVWMAISGNVLKTDAAPRGIVSFELRWTAERSQAIVDSWRAIGVVPKAVKNIRRDWFFIAAYVITLGLLYGWLSYVLGVAGYEKFSRFFLVLAWLQVIAGLLDVVENFCLLKILGEDQLASSFLPRTACICAATKFVLTGIGMGIPFYVFFTEGF